jgi:hypothetical protein
MVLSRHTNVSGTGNGEAGQDMARGTTVDMLSLGDFQTTLKSRLAEVDAVLEKIETGLLGHPPAVGTFTDARAARDKYESVLADHHQRAVRLRSAIVAAQTATARILSNYRTTEDRNAADANEIASALDGVRTALEENGNSDA